MVQLRRTLMMQLAGLLVAAAILIALSRFLPLADWLAGMQERVMGLGPYSAFWYTLLFALCNVLLLPGGVLSLGGGFFFGLWWGFFIVAAGNIIGAAISFFISRWVGERWLHHRLSQHATIAALGPAIEREGWKIILLSQLHPLFPTSLMNYVYGLTNIRFRTCMFWVAIGKAPGLFLYTYLGTLGQHGLNLVRGKTRPQSVEFLLWGSGLAVTALILFIVGRMALRMLEERKEAAAAEEGIAPETQFAGSVTI